MTKLEDLLSQTATADPAIRELFNRLRVLYQKRYWFEFSEVLSQLIYQHQTFDARALIMNTIDELSVYNDPVFIVEITDVFLSRWSPATIDEQMKLINRIREIFSRNEIALQYLKILEAKVHLASNNLEQGLELEKQAEKAIEAMREVPKVIYAALQEIKAMYYWSKEDYDSYYATAVKWLAYLDDKKLSQAAQLQLAENILEAGLVNNSTLSFGTLLENNLVASLRNDPTRTPLFKVLEIFGKGNVESFELFISQAGESLKRFGLIGANIDKLRRKIRVIAFYDSVFFSQKRNFEQMSLSFKEIANIAQINQNEVERLIVYVLSIGIFQGYVDELEQKFYITRTKPQELDPTRIAQLKENFDQWREGILKTIEFINKC